MNELINDIRYFKSFEDKTACLKRVLTLLAAQKRLVTVYTRSRRFIDQFTCIDTPLKPFTIRNFWLSGELIYSKDSPYNYIVTGFDDIIKITYEGEPIT